MADAKITALTELNATPETTDILPIVDDPGGSPVTKKITVANLMAAASGGYQIATLELSAANINAMGGAPITFVSSGGAGTIILVNQFIMDFTYNSVAFTGGSSVALKEETSGTVLLTGPAAALVTGTASFRRMYYGLTNVNYVTDKDIQISTTSGANFADGNSTAKVYLIYRIVTL